MRPRIMEVWRILVLPDRKLGVAAQLSVAQALDQALAGAGRIEISLFRYSFSWQAI